MASHFERASAFFIICALVFNVPGLASYQAWAIGIKTRSPVNGSTGTSMPPKEVLGHVTRLVTDALAIHLQGTSGLGGPESGIVAAVPVPYPASAMAGLQEPLLISDEDHERIMRFLAWARRTDPPQGAVGIDSALGEALLHRNFMPRVPLDLAAARALAGQGQSVVLSLNDIPIVEASLQSPGMDIPIARHILAKLIGVLRAHEGSQDVEDTQGYALTASFWDGIMREASLDVRDGVAGGSGVLLGELPKALQSPVLLKPPLPENADTQRIELVEGVPSGHHVQGFGALTGKPGDSILNRLISDAGNRLGPRASGEFAAELRRQYEIQGIEPPTAPEQILNLVLELQGLFSLPFSQWLGEQIRRPTARNGVDVESVGVSVLAINRAIEKFNTGQDRKLPLVNPNRNAQSNEVYILQSEGREHPERVAERLKELGELPNLRDVGAFYAQGKIFVTASLAHEATPQQLIAIVLRLKLQMNGFTPQEAEDITTQIAQQAFGGIKLGGTEFRKLIHIANVPPRKREAAQVEKGAPASAESHGSSEGANSPVPGNSRSDFLFKEARRFLLVYSPPLLLGGIVLFRFLISGILPGSLDIFLVLVLGYLSFALNALGLFRTHIQEHAKQKALRAISPETPQSQDPAQFSTIQLESLGVINFEDDSHEYGKHWSLYFSDGRGWELSLGMGRVGKKGPKMVLDMTWYQEGDEDASLEHYRIMPNSGEKGEEAIFVSVFRENVLPHIDKAVERYLDPDSKKWNKSMRNTARFMKIFKEKLQKMDGGEGVGASQ